MTRSVSFVIDSDIDTRITITEQDDGSLLFEVEVLETGLQGDLRGIFFDLDGGPAILPADISGDDVTEARVAADGIDSLGGDANVKGEVAKASGKFDVGVEFGSSGMAKDDIQYTAFVIQGLSIDDISLQDFALRYTSVGTVDGERSGGRKILGQATAAPDAVDDSFTTDEDTALAAGNVLDNDTDADNDGLTVNLVDGDAAKVGQPVDVVTAGGRAGQVTIDADGAVSFVPGPAFDDLAAGESDSFTITYGVTDGNGGADTEAVVTVTIDGVNDAPQAGDDAFTTDEDTAISVAAKGVLGNDSDPDASDTLTVSAIEGVAAEVGNPVTLASGALVTLNADGSFGYDPNGQFESLDDGDEALDSFSYTVSDGKGGSANARVDVTVKGKTDSSVVVATFEEFGGDDLFHRPGDYLGLTWSEDWWVMETDEYWYDTGYQNGVVSGQNVAFNGFAQGVSIEHGSFDLESAWLTAAWNDGLTVRVTGFADDVVTGVQSFTVSTDGPTFVEFDDAKFDNVDSVLFDSFGGTPAFNWYDEHFAIDDITFIL